jgi:hypothetical protein
MRKAAKKKRARKKREPPLTVFLDFKPAKLPPRPANPDPTRHYAEDVADEKPEKPLTKKQMEAKIRAVQREMRRRKREDPEDDDGLPF